MLEQVPPAHVQGDQGADKQTDEQDVGQDIQKVFKVIHMFRLLVDMAKMIQEKMSHPMVASFPYSPSCGNNS